MPQFDLRDIYVAEYTNTDGVVSYSGRTKAGDAMSANIELKFAEGRCYAEGGLAEYVKEATGGSIALGVKYIPIAAQKTMFGKEDSSRLGIAGLKTTKQQSGKDVGVTLIAPDKVNGVKKFTALFVARAQFGAPAMSFKTKEKETIVFQMPTTTGEFMPDDSDDGLLIDSAVCDSLADARDWCANCLGVTVLRPGAVNFSKAGTADVTATLTAPADATVSSVKEDATALTVTTDYTVDNGTFTIKKAYFADVSNGVHTYILTMSNGDTVALKVTVAA